MSQKRRKVKTLRIFSNSSVAYPILKNFYKQLHIKIIGVMEGYPPRVRQFQSAMLKFFLKNEDIEERMDYEN